MKGKKYVCKSTGGVQKSSSRSRSRSPLDKNRRNERKEIHSQEYRELSKSRSRSKTPQGQYTSHDERKQIHHVKYRSHSKSRSRSKSAKLECNIQANIKSIVNNLHCLPSIQDSHPNVIDIILQKGGNQGNVKRIMMDKMTKLK